MRRDSPLVNLRLGTSARRVRSVLSCWLVLLFIVSLLSCWFVMMVMVFVSAMASVAPALRLRRELGR